ncbi:DNA-binding response regulator [Betaproteobacteria bacterium]|nr:DNA-binding response regulator [Betaproteobacteria bacterium]GHU08982.1 DNA-binding response regulator [Betaproteobacteria bacterium]GHU20418.1 DNA-binding response regulator [Betaproteobacteria bacterium]
MSVQTLRVMIVDDEAPARQRLRELLGDIAAQLPTRLVGMAANGIEALRLLDEVGGEVDVVLADISMPAMNGVELARQIAARTSPPAVVFTTAYENYAVEAFDLAATDYLMKPVRADRLATALARARAAIGGGESGAAAPGSEGEPAHFNVTERDRIMLLAVTEVIYLRAELKYVTACTASREYLLTETLVQIEQAHPNRFLRIHRNCLVARNAIVGVRRAGEHKGEVHWEMLLQGVEGALPISRRQWQAVREMLKL